MTRAVAYHLQPVGRRATTDDLTLVTNTELTGPGQKQLASSVGEPSVSAVNAVVMYTGNWYAARSVDGAQTFQYIHPFPSFPHPPNPPYLSAHGLHYTP